MKHHFYLWVVFLFISSSLIGQSFKATTNAREVLVGHTFEVVFTFDAKGDKDFRAPSFDGFKVLAGPFRGNQQTIFNGSVSYQSSYTYQLAGLRSGQFTIKPASISHKGKKYFSNELTVSVIKESNSTNQNENIFIQTVVLDTPAYPGSQIRVDYLLFTKVKIDEIDLMAEDDFKEFISTTLPISNEGHYEVVDGQQYLVRPIKQLALYPIQPGIHRIKPLMLQARIPEKTTRRGRSLFDEFFSRNSYQEKLVTSDEFTIQVHPFPENPPAHFSGVTGVLEVDITTSDTRFTTDDALSIKVNMKGKAHNNSVQAPTLACPSELDIYDPKLVLDTFLSKDGRQVFSKTYEYLVQPNQAGEFELNILSAYFDPMSQSFKEVDTAPIKIQVSQGTEQVADQESAPVFNPKWTKWWPWLLGGLVIIGLGGWFLRNRPNKKVVPSPAHQESKPQKAAQPEPGGVIAEEKETTPNETRAPRTTDYFVLHADLHGDALLKEVLRETEHFFEDKLDIPYAQLEKAEVFKRLSAKGISAESIQHLRSWWQEVEFSIYAHRPLPYPEEECLAKIKNIVGELEIE